MSDPFADIPTGRQTSGKPATPFDDILDNSSATRKLIKKAGADPFADIPAKGPAVYIAPRDSTAKVYWDATKKAFVDSWGEIKQGYGTKRPDGTTEFKNPWELLKTESLPAHLVQAAQRRGSNQEVAPVDVDEEGNPIAAPAAEKSDATDPGVVADLKALGVTAKEHPGILIGSLVKSVASDPELLLPWLWEAIPEATAARVAQAARAMGAGVDVAKAAEVGGRIGGRMTVGAGTSAAVEAGSQAAAGDHDLGKLGTAAAEGAIASIPGRMVGKKGVVLHGDPAIAIDQSGVPGAAKGSSADLTPAEMKTASSIPEERVTAIDSSRESLARATAEDPITPAMVAEVGKEPIRSPTESRERLVRAMKQAATGGAIGAAVGYGVASDDSKLTGLETGLAIGAGLPLLKARRYTGPDISALVNARNGQVRAVMRHAYQFQHQIEKAVPVKADREHLAMQLDKGVEPHAGTPEHDAWRNLKSFFADMGQLAKDSGVVRELRENYISHIVEVDPNQRATLFHRIFGGPESAGTGKGATSFGKERRYDTFEDLQKAIEDSGLRVKTKDASEIAGIYANAVYKSIADKRLLSALRETKTADGLGLIAPAEKAPPHYVRPGGILTGHAVHPDIVHDLEFVFNQRNPNAAFRKLAAITSVAKRLTISFSLFHAKSLWEGFIIASNGSLKDRVTPRTAAKAALKIYREGGNNDGLDHLIKNGLVVGTPEDVAGRELNTALTRLSDTLNDRLPLRGLGVGSLAKGLAAIDRGVEHLTFGFLQTGLKINVALSEFERMVSSGVDRDRAARLAASYSNDIFGSLDYYRVATDTDSHIMRKLGTATLNQNSRKVLQLIMFAPDWTMATFRTMAKAMPGGATSIEAMQAHRRYLIKAAIYYLAAGNAVNYAMSGHSVFQNKNPTRLELSDGRTMQFAKHETEPLEWLRDPANTALNKGAFIPATVKQIYRSHVTAAAYKKPAPTPADDALQVADEFVPISLQQFVQNGYSTDDLYGALGFPVYGHKVKGASQN